jgi:hypothetical protein
MAMDRFKKSEMNFGVDASAVMAKAGAGAGAPRSMTAWRSSSGHSPAPCWMRRSGGSTSSTSLGSASRGTRRRDARRVPLAGGDR